MVILAPAYACCGNPGGGGSQLIGNPGDQSRKEIRQPSSVVRLASHLKATVPGVVAGVIVHTTTVEGHRGVVINKESRRAEREGRLGVGQNGDSGLSSHICLHQRSGFVLCLRILVHAVSRLGRKGHIGRQIDLRGDLIINDVQEKRTLLRGSENHNQGDNKLHDIL